MSLHERDVMEHIESLDEDSPLCTCCCEFVDRKSYRRILPCRHLYCLSCLGVRCRMGISDRSMVPAHCCDQAIPLEMVKEVLTRQEVIMYTRFVSEKQSASQELLTDREYTNMVKDMGWTLCPGCGVGVERISGCNWMKCPRGHTFCIVCGTKWGTCSCNTALYASHPRVV